MYSTRPCIGIGTSIRLVVNVCDGLGVICLFQRSIGTGTSISISGTPSLLTKRSRTTFPVYSRCYGS